MNIAMTVWEHRISPVFDSARTLLVAYIENGKITHRRREPFNPAFPLRLVDRFNELEIETLICGAIARTPAAMIEAANIQLTPFICGVVDDVLEACASGVPITPKFLMPGCCGRRRGRKNKCEAVFVPKKEVNAMPRGDGTGPRGQGGCTTGKGSRGQGRGAGGRGSGAGGKGRGVCKGGKGGSGAGRGMGRGSSRDGNGSSDE